MRVGKTARVGARLERLRLGESRGRIVGVGGNMGAACGSAAEREGESGWMEEKKLTGGPRMSAAGERGEGEGNAGGLAGPSRPKARWGGNGFLLFFSN